jgi:hypothetical protein
VKYIEFLALHSQPESVKRQIEDRCCIERQQLTHYEPSDDANPKRLPEFGSCAGPEGQGERAK